MSDSYITKDESLITELQHPDRDPCRNQSLARAVINPGQSTLLHKHTLSEEIYFVETGKGILTCGNQQLAMTAGESACISPGTPHKIDNIGDSLLSILCCCAPAYSHDDTEVLE